MKIKLSVISLIGASIFSAGIASANVSQPPIIKLGGVKINHVQDGNTVNSGTIDASAIGVPVGTSLVYTVSCNYAVDPSPTTQSPAAMGYSREENTQLYINTFNVDGVSKYSPYGVTTNSGIIKIEISVHGPSPQLVFYNYDATGDMTLSDCTAQLQYSTIK